MAQSISREAALRVALAARELGSLPVRKLISALVERLELPLTEAKLATVTVADLQLLLQGDDVVESEVPREQLKQAVRLLWGEGIANHDLPPVAHYADGDMPGSIRVACASNREQLLDGHFGSCERFLVYQVSPVEVRLIDVRPTLAADHAEDRNVARAALIHDCQIVYVQSIGGPATAKVVRAGIHPVKVANRGDSGGEALQALAQLQQALHHPPPWLARIMGVEAGSLAPFAAALAAGEA
ncbi:dinitrogenase iron-molybdenum cofactor biosynthesis protein [Candidatus Accumulibacter cognatus]|uniref:Nitrogen fixation protein NifX n=1 Tax=Candidatus Accumulibacter cognatus TaxID=2954383 RepID=A0A080MDQ7_9PROT|nr:dinitrogenase iron-molybdenum cofactor biosynthesis protein [Candidatus Accumulibacter cognatus]KFB75364.1 MAG: nitrogen fixation protein NifX [Candidatus Accumulibacter cognatus]